MVKLQRAAIALAIALLASGSGSLSAQEPTVPDWMEVDHDAQTVSMEIVAGSTDENRAWNFNGYFDGSAEIIVPEGYEVTIEFVNEDTQNPHSLGIGEPQDTYPPDVDPTPVFDGAVTRGATSKARATQSGQSETITFTAEAEGEYAMICYIQMHAAMGMWTYFTVSPDDAVGVVETGAS
ncbi:MAG: sulfocyanin-like copper-binding protein [Longimicrobiales bacterium]